MKISELIAKLQELQAADGDLDVLDGDKFHEIDQAYMLEVENDDDFPKDWNMPAGTKVCLLRYG